MLITQFILDSFKPFKWEAKGIIKTVAYISVI